MLNALTWAQEARKESDADEARIADQLEHTLRKEVPAASGILDKFKGSMSGNLANWLGVVIALISLLISVESSFSEHDLEQILQQTVQQLQNERTPAAPADSTPAIPSQAPESPGPGPAERKG